MTTPIRVVGLGGSLHLPSNSLAALQLAVAGAQEAGAETEVLDIRELDLPFYQPGMARIPASVERLCESVFQAGGMLWASPLYHGTISGSFKNALDWLQLLSDRDPPYLTDKVIGLISTAGGTQGLQAVNTMEFVVRALRGWAVPLVIPIPKAWQAFDAQGRARDQAVEQQLHALGREVARAARQFAMEPPLTTADVAAAESALQPLTDEDMVS